MLPTFFLFLLATQVETPPAAPVFADHVSQYGFTWRFDRPCRIGQFANGDWWVVGPVTLTDITPQLTIDTDLPGIAERTRNGSMLNPTVPQDVTGTHLDQGFDSHLYEAQSGDLSDDHYDPTLNIATQLPLEIPPDTSIISTESFEDFQRPQIKKAAILTVVPEPMHGKLRPGYCGAGKTYFDESRIEWDRLLNLNPDPNQTGLMPSWELLNGALKRPWIDFIQADGGFSDLIHPFANMPHYSRNMCAVMGDVALAVHTDFDLEVKRDATISLIQLGIDNFSVVENGGQQIWFGAGGQCNGRKWPILFAGIMLDDPLMKNVGFDPDVIFGEDGQTFFVEWQDLNSNGGVDAPLEVNNGNGGYCADAVGLAEFGTRHFQEPQKDNAAWTVGSSAPCNENDVLAQDYRVCCTANSWYGQAVAASLMNAKELWNHEPFFAYMKRYTDHLELVVMPAHPDPLPFWLAWSDWSLEIYRAYYR